MSSWVQRPGVIPSDQGRWEIIRLWRWIHLVWVGMGNRWWRQRAVPYGMRALQPVMSLDVLQQEGRGLQSLRAALVQPEQVTDAYENMSQWFLEVADTCEKVFFTPTQNLSDFLISFSFGCTHLNIQNFQFWHLVSKGIWGLLGFRLSQVLDLELENGLIDQNWTWYLEGQRIFYLPWGLRVEIHCILRTFVQMRKVESICQIKEQVGREGRQ